MRVIHYGTTTGSARRRIGAHLPTQPGVRQAASCNGFALLQARRQALNLSV
jgi:hypothetical protein